MLPLLTTVAKAAALVAKTAQASATVILVTNGIYSWWNKKKQSKSPDALYKDK